METTDVKPTLMHAEPVLAVHDVIETVKYWHEILGFPEKWTWGDPPDHGGVHWNGAASVQFSLNPGLAEISAGYSVWIRVKHLESLYALHQKNAKVVSPLQNRPWGMAEYTVQEINGYYITFSAPVTERTKTVQPHAGSTRIVLRKPSLSEFKSLSHSVNWEAASDAILEMQWQAAILTVVAEDTATGKAIGCAFLCGDDTSFYYVKDVIVHPDWQGRGIGTSIMKELTSWLEKHAKAHATVGLFTGEHLVSFYKQFGFMQACGMYRSIKEQKS
jgi:GNAT superfamily N-acetyltransferase